MDRQNLRWILSVPCRSLLNSCCRRFTAERACVRARLSERANERCASSRQPTSNARVHRPIRFSLRFRSSASPRAAAEARSEADRGASRLVNRCYAFRGARFVMNKQRQSSFQQTAEVFIIIIHVSRSHANSQTHFIRSPAINSV